MQSTCPHCQNVTEARSLKPGETFRCPGCGELVQVIAPRSARAQQRYPALNMVQGSYRAVGAVASVVFAVLTIVILAQGSRFSIAYALVFAIGSFVTVVTLLAASEGIRVMLDIADDIRHTRELAERAPGAMPARTTAGMR